MNKILFSGYDYFHPVDFSITSPQGYDYSLLVITHTPAQFRVDGEFRRFPAHSAVFYPPGSPVEYGACGEEFGNDWIRFVSDESFVTGFSRQGQPFPVSDMAYCHNLIQLLTWESSADGYETVISQLLYILFYKLEDDLLHHKSTAHDQQLLALRRNIMNNPQQKWNIADMARQMYLSMGYLQSLYKKKFGISCMDDVIRCRVRRAKDLLTNTDQSIYSVAEQCGYNDVEHFCRQFKAISGMTPREFRQSVHKLNDTALPLPE